MLKPITIFFLSLLMVQFLFAQEGDILVLKKRSKTEKYFFSGSSISFFDANGRYLQGQITRIANDSIWYKEFVTQRSPTIFGTYKLDTLGTMRRVMHYSAIAGFEPKKKNFNPGNMGGTLFVGGSLLAIGSGISFIVDPKKASKPLAFSSLAAVGLGYLLLKIPNKDIIVGKRGYRLEFLKVK